MSLPLVELQASAKGGTGQTSCGQIGSHGSRNARLAWRNSAHGRQSAAIGGRK